MRLLDTNVVSELRRPRPHPQVQQWLRSVESEPLFLSVVTVAEIQDGIERRRNQDPNEALVIEDWLERVVLPQFLILSMDVEVAREWSRLMQGQPDRLLKDATIAATAQVYGFQVVTRNVRDFDQLGVPTLNPFEFTG